MPAQAITDDSSATAADQRANTEGETPQSAITLRGSVIPRGTKRQTDSPAYPLFRSHAPQYYPPKTARTAMLLSATLPGLGQTYAGRSEKGLVFLIGGIGLVAIAGFNLDRAVHYNDLADRFTTGFYDPHGDAFLTADQGHVKSRSHAQLGALFLAGGIGVYIWNIFDAAKTVDRYNERRFPVQVQQIVYGQTYLTVNHRF
ncbi:MAG: hypothetical protein O7E52_06835 [Candidatus Poribacteria bacterium]|nr:hypothetical protein [Candidatus Poribacteria bacterium]